jgi:muconolactone delta-isomerase
VLVRKGNKKMKILALENELPGLTAADFQPHLQAEARRIWDLQQSGAVREVYFTAEHHTAVLVLECGNAEAAHHLLDTLPLVRAGLITFDVIPLVPYDGVARLFA